MSGSKRAIGFSPIPAIALVGCVVTAGLLACWLGQGTKATITLPNEPIEVALGVLATENIPSVGEWQRRADEAVAVSPDGKWIAVAGHDEMVRLFGAGGREQWRFRIPESYGKTLGFSTDSQMVFAGECSMDGKVYGIDVNEGKARWSYSISDDVGRPASNQPVTYRTLDKCCLYSMMPIDGALLAVGTHRDRRLTALATGASVVNDTLNTVLYAFHPATGKLLWRYPAQETMDTHMPYLRYSKTLNQVLGANTSYWRQGTPEEKYPNGTVRLIDARSGVQSCAYRIKPTFMAYTNIWYSLAISPNGRFISVGTVDGRLILLEVKAGPALVEVWEKEVSSLLEVSGIPIYACSSRNVVFDNGDIFMTTSSTHARQTSAGIVRQPPNQHPDSNSAFLFDRNGRILWKWKAPGDITDVRVHLESGLTVVLVEHNYVERSLDAAGFYFMKYRKGEPSVVEHLGALQLSGVSTSGEIAPDGSFFAGIELPIRLADDTLAGEHKLHIIPTRFLADASVDK